MLVFTRRSEEAVVVGETVGLEGTLRIKVLQIGRNYVKLGFEVNRNVPVHREEVWERIHTRGPPIRLKGGG